MKRILTILIALIAVISVNAQSSFALEKSGDISMSKMELYKATKSFIKNYWNSDDYIKNDDTASILVKGVLYQTVNHLFEHKYSYSYNVKFLIKDNKYKVLIENVECESATASITTTIPYVNFCDGCEFPGSSATNLSKKKWTILMGNIKNELEGIASSYERHLKQ